MLSVWHCSALIGRRQVRQGVIKAAMNGVTRRRTTHLVTTSHISPVDTQTAGGSRAPWCCITGFNKRSPDCFLLVHAHSFPYTNLHTDIQSQEYFCLPFVTATNPRPWNWFKTRKDKFLSWAVLRFLRLTVEIAYRKKSKLINIAEKRRVLPNLLRAKRSTSYTCTHM